MSSNSPQQTISQEQIKTLTRLCRIHCSDEEEASLRADLEKMLGYVAQLNSVDTADVPPCLQVIEDLKNVWVDDVPHDTLPRDLFLLNAPDSIAGMIRVPTVINQE